MESGIHIPVCTHLSFVSFIVIIRIRTVVVEGWIDGHGKQLSSYKSPYLFVMMAKPTMSLVTRKDC